MSGHRYEPGQDGRCRRCGCTGGFGPHAAERRVRYGRPVRLDIGGAAVDVGSETRPRGLHARLAVDDGDRAVDLLLTELEARALAQALLHCLS